MRVQLVDPPAYTPPYDHALAAALARAGAQVELVTSRFAYGDVPAADGYIVSERFYRSAVGAPASRLRRASKLAAHVPDMLVWRHDAQRHADVVHLQWLTVPWLDGWLLPDRPLVLTAHDLLPREPRPGQVAAQRRLLARMDAVVVHSRYGAAQLVDRAGVPAEKVTVIPHGAFDRLARIPPAPLPEDLAAVTGPVVLFFGLLRPYKGVDVLLEAWRGVRGGQRADGVRGGGGAERADGVRGGGGAERVGGPELWIVGRPRMDIAPLRAAAGPGVRFVPRFVPDAELAALFRRADIVVLPYARTERFDQSGVLATALAFGTPAVVTDIGGFGEVAAAGAARLVAPGDPAALGAALSELVADPRARAALAAGARAAAAGPYSWDTAARETLALYRRLV
ncbi:MAG TPA: glycosyltransferase family 4 protein [Solirubrobacteraceae bacterium]|nr:glycosyltransferase family 4 protein [Solirubrobacteraceae bacterium]